MISRIAAGLAAVLALQAQPGPDAACGCPDLNGGAGPTGVVWTGRPGVPLRQLAGLLAPVLWFSSDEPLIVLRDNGAVPHAHPCDRAPTSGVVYYQPAAIVLRGDERVQDPADDDPRFFEKVDHFILRYFFYYDEDWGLGRHKHDLEVVNLYVHLDRLSTDCYRVRVARIEGLAHGVDWYSNILRVEADTVFPPMILVEEGKHASCPDRNADGIYTPGYDTNVHNNDAWGLRDVLGSSVLLGSRFTASMAKPRDPSFRVFPPETALHMCTSVDRRIAYRAEDSLGRYELRSAKEVPKCSPPGPEPERLLSMMRTHRFGAGYPSRQYDSDFEKELSNPENVTRWISAVNARVQSRRVGAIVQGPGFDAREFWVVPRAYVSPGTYFVDALVTPSASRWADWYAAAGFEQARNGDGDGIRGIASEVGMKFRLTIPGRYRWGLLGYRFGGLRIGIRANGISRLHSPRLIFELGAGAF